MSQFQSQVSHEGIAKGLLMSKSKYWDEYSNLQFVKHELIKNYLNGWFPKLGFWAGKIIYCDTHAGRGRHRTGHLGSPLVALQTFMNHRSRDAILRKSKVLFTFIEENAHCKAELDAEIASFGEIPDRVQAQSIAADCFKTLQTIVADLRKAGQQIAPAFIFVDPYGFKIPGSILIELMQFKRVELFVNVIWRELDMAMRQGDVLQNTVDSIFVDQDWREVARIDDHNQRAIESVNLIRHMTGAKWATHIRMLGANQATRYMLVHLTNHDKGRDLMKECVWKCCPNGGYYARKTDDPKQEMLIRPDPNLAPLQRWIAENLQTGAKRWQDLHDLLREELWLPKHLNSAITAMRKSGKISGSEYEGRFSATTNPLLTLEK